MSVNRGKRSIGLDLKPQDRAKAIALAGQADVIIENFRPGVMDRLGLGAAHCGPNIRASYFVRFQVLDKQRPKPAMFLMVQGIKWNPNTDGFTRRPTQ